MSNLSENPLEASRPACRQFEQELAAYLEGESRPEVARHAESCAFCSALLGDLEMIRAQARALPLDEPPVRVWANVRAALAAEGLIRERTRRAGWFAFPKLAHWAAPLGALAAMAVLSITLLVPSGSIDHSSTAAWLSIADRDATAARVLASEDSELASTVGELEKNFNAHSASLEPSVKQVYMSGLKSLNDSIRECRRAVEREPGNTLARHYLMAAYTQKAEVLAAALKFDVP
jgi:hypothetical protein